MPVIFIKSGGVEGKFKEIYQRFREPYILLASGLHNSLAASLEILSFLKQQGKRAEILHGDIDYIVERLNELIKIFDVKSKLSSTRLGVLGKPSDWLISSNADYKKIKELLGITLVDIDINELMDEIEKKQDNLTDRFEELYGKGFNRHSMDGAMSIYFGLKSIVKRYSLDCITVRCFDLLGIYNNTGCLGVSLLNDEGIIAGCEGDVPALISMVLLNKLTGQPVFMANPSGVDIKRNTAILAHCTLPTSMTEEYSFDTHFESGIGVGIKGKVKEGRGTIFKISGDLNDYFVSGIDIERNLDDKNLCRTQILIKMDEKAEYFLKRPIGNHHIVCRGDYSSIIREFFNWV